MHALNVILKFCNKLYALLDKCKCNSLYGHLDNEVFEEENLKKESNKKQKTDGIVI